MQINPSHRLISPTEVYQYDIHTKNGVYTCHYSYVDLFLIYEEAIKEEGPLKVQAETCGPILGVDEELHYYDFELVANLLYTFDCRDRLNLTLNK